MERMTMKALSSDVASPLMRLSSEMETLGAECVYFKKKGGLEEEHDSAVQQRQQKRHQKPDVGLLSFCAEGEACVADESSSLGGRCLALPAFRSRKIDLKKNNWKANNLNVRGLNRKKCPDSCNQELCECIEAYLYAHHCHSELSYVCLAQTLDACVSPSYMYFYEVLYCPFAFCLEDKRSYADCNCDYYLEYCDIYSIYPAARDKCAVADCCQAAIDSANSTQTAHNKAHLDAKKAQCFEKAPSTAPSAPPSSSNRPSHTLMPTALPSQSVNPTTTTASPSFSRNSTNSINSTNSTNSMNNQFQNITDPNQPTQSPIFSPTDQPTSSPTAPTSSPTTSPTAPTSSPTKIPTLSPTIYKPPKPLRPQLPDPFQTTNATTLPSIQPSAFITKSPTDMPTTTGPSSSSPTYYPTYFPTSLNTDTNETTITNNDTNANIVNNTNNEQNDLVSKNKNTLSNSASQYTSVVWISVFATAFTSIISLYYI